MRRTALIAIWAVLLTLACYRHKEFAMVFSSFSLAYNLALWGVNGKH